MTATSFIRLKDRIRNSKLFKDAFWSIMGSGIGNMFLLLSGILIARFLGKDLYGEYGVAKTNMFYMAGFSTFGLVYSSTRYIAKYLNTDNTRIIGIITNATKITFFFSVSISFILALFAVKLAAFLDAPNLASVFRTLSIIIILKALSSTGNGILAGLKKFSVAAKSNVVSGITMFFLSIPLTYFWGLNGALFSLAASQLVNLLLNYAYIYRTCKQLPVYYYNEDDIKTLLKFSFPIALQEISFALCNWLGILMLTKMSTLGEVGLYSAAAQWNAVITMIPSLLANVVLSHLSGSEGKKQQILLYKMLFIYFICTFIPFLFVYIGSDFIISFYGKDFLMMKQVLLVSILATIPTCCSDIFKAELIALGKTWILFILRMAKDLVLVIAAGFFLLKMNGENGAYYYAMSNFLGAILFFIGSLIVYLKCIKSDFTKNAMYS